MSKKYNLLLPIAGKAQRFLDNGYSMPKPLIMAKDRHILDLSMSSIKLDECNIIFAVRIEHVNNFSIDNILRDKFGDDIKLVIVEKDTEGSVSTCVLAKEYINNDLPLIIYTPDVYFERQFDPSQIPEDVDGFLLTFKANSPNHSYAQLNENGLVTKTAEKEVISENAAVGVYYFKTGKMFLDYAEEMIQNNLRVKNEFYICPMYNQLVRDNRKVAISQVEKMHVLGTPEELEFFIDYVTPRFGVKPVALCADHSGMKIKEQAKKVLKRNNIDFIDFGTYNYRDCDYNEYVKQACKAIEDKTCDFGIGFCRTGQGVNILANHMNNIRSALLIDGYTAEHSIRHNCANFFAIPEKYVSESELEAIIEKLKTSSFDGGRHMTRMKKTIGVKR